MATDATETINVAERGVIRLLEEEITQILTAMQEESSQGTDTPEEPMQVTDTIDTDIFAEDVPDPIITPAEATTDLEIDEDPDSDEDVPRIDMELRVLNKLLERVDRVLYRFSTRSPNGLSRLSHQSHSLVLQGAEAMELNLTTSNTHFIHTTPNSYSFVHVHPGPINAAEIGRHDFSIINKGTGVLLLIMHNRVRDEETQWHRLLEAYQKYDLSIVNDGIDTILC